LSEPAAIILAVAMNNMNARYRLICRGHRQGRFYAVEKATGKRTSLHTTDADEARQIVEAKNQAERQPVLNLQIAKAYLAGTDNGIATRSWQNHNFCVDMNWLPWSHPAQMPMAESGV
jgi:hypothetical protein